MNERTRAGNLYGVKYILHIRVSIQSTRVCRRVCEEMVQEEPDRMESGPSAGCEPLSPAREQPRDPKIELARGEEEKTKNEADRDERVRHLPGHTCPHV